MISVKRKLLQAINTSFSRHFPEYSMFGHFWPFFTICACLWATPWTHLRFYWQKCYHWVRLQWNLRRESYSRLLPPFFGANCRKIQFQAIFGHFQHFMDNFLIPPPLLSTGFYHWVLLQWYLQRESYSRLLPLFSWKFHFWPFWPFFTICSCLWATPWPHLRFYWQKCYHWVLLQWYLRRKSYFRLLPQHSPPMTWPVK